MGCAIPATTASTCRATIACWVVIKRGTTGALIGVVIALAVASGCVGAVPQATPVPSASAAKSIGLGPYLTQPGVDPRFAADPQTSGFLERMWGRPVTSSR